MTVIALPLPPSTNNLFATVKALGKGGSATMRRVRSKGYRKWAEEARSMLHRQKPEKVAGPVMVLISCPRVALADVDNRNKALIDLLVKYGAMDDDRNVVAVCTCWGAEADDLAYVRIVPAQSINLEFRLASDGAGGGFFVNAPLLESENDGLEIE